MIKTSPDTWKKTLLSHWILVLRTLSRKENYPLEPVYNSKQWAQKQTSAQIGSYSELKHSTVLYTKQPFVMKLCSHPEVYVEPNLVCWEELMKMIKNLKGIISKVAPSSNEQAAFLFRFEYTLCLLSTATKMQHKPLSTEFNEQIKGIMYSNWDDYYNKTFYHGWYYELFYKANLAKDASPLQFDPEITDIFTDEGDIGLGDDGCVLHVGLKEPKIGIIILSDTYSGKEKCFLMAGYNPEELYFTPGDRWTDSRWKKKLEYSQNKVQDPKSNSILLSESSTSNSLMNNLLHNYDQNENNDNIMAKPPNVL